MAFPGTFLKSPVGFVAPIPKEKRLTFFSLFKELPEIGKIVGQLNALRKFLGLSFGVSNLIVSLTRCIEFPERRFAVPEGTNPFSRISGMVSMGTDRIYYGYELFHPAGSM